MAMPGRAQQAPQSRYAFVDSTLMRDTLGLRFDGLFPIADSLGIPPDSLRAHSIRYRYTLPRLLKLSDSLGMPVDSVGTVMYRERFNPLAASRRGAEFAYRTTYTIHQYSTAWANGTDFVLPAGPVLVSGSTSSQFDRRTTGGRTNLDQTRTLFTRADWRFSRNFTMGGAANLSRTDNRARGSLNNFKIDDSRFDLSVVSRQQPRRGMTSELSLSTGLVGTSGSTEEKRGLSGGLNGRLRYAPRPWVTSDFNGGVSGNAARSRLPGALDYSRTEDASGNLRGTLGLFTASPMGLNVNYSLRDSRVETLGDTGQVQQVKSGNESLDMSFRLRRDNDRYLTVGQKFGSSRQASATNPTSQNSVRDQGLTVGGRYALLGLSLDANFGRLLKTTKYPQRGGASGGYAEDRDSRSVDATLSWPLSRRITTRALGSVRLERTRYFILGSYPNSPVPRDQYDQSYRLEGRYTHSQRFSSDLGLEVGRSLFVNIPAASTAANTETRRYRGNWNWTFRILSGLTATQVNTITANYVYYTFLPPSSDRLVLDYYSQTRLNADITPRLHVDVTHDRRYQPSGGYGPLDPPLDDGNSYFSQADENRLSVLSARMSYSLGRSLSLSIAPTYTETERNGVSQGVVVPQNATRSLYLLGSASLNFPIGNRGQLTGSITRNLNSERRTTYFSGLPSDEPRTEYGYVSGQLEFSWEL